MNIKEKAQKAIYFLKTKLKNQQNDQQMKAKNNLGLVEYCIAQLGKPYWYGTFGNIGTRDLYEYKKNQYPKYYLAKDYDTQFGQRVHDCIGLVKGYMWSETIDSKPVYCSNDFPDLSANGFYDHCKRKSLKMSTMPDIPGILVFMPGHVGVYIGNGEVIEARGHAYGVVKTKLKNRNWTKWAFIEEISYITE